MLSFGDFKIKLIIYFCLDLLKPRTDEKQLCCDVVANFFLIGDLLLNSLDSFETLFFFFCRSEKSLRALIY